jgi:hypothetical protein
MSELINVSQYIYMRDNESDIYFIQNDVIMTTYVNLVLQVRISLSLLRS